MTATNTTRTGAASAYSDSTGHYAISGLATGPVVLEATFARSSVRRTVTVRQGSTVTASTLTLPAAPKLGTIVVKAKGYSCIYVERKPDGATCNSVRKGKATNRYGDEIGYQTTDKHGHFRTSSVVVSGRYTVRTSSFETGTTNVLNAGRSFTVKAGKPVRLHALQMKRGGTLTGRVVDSRGKAVQGLEIYVGAVFGSPDAVTDSHGRYTIRGITTGKHWVRITDPYVGGYVNRNKIASAVGGSTRTVPTVTVR